MSAFQTRLILSYSSSAAVIIAIPSRRSVAHTAANRLAALDCLVVHDAAVDSGGLNASMSSMPTATAEQANIFVVVPIFFKI